MRTIPSSDAVDAAEAFGEILRHRMPEPRPDEYDNSFTEFWDSLKNDGWLEIAQELSQDGSIVNLTIFAETWGRHLVPLPFIEAIAQDFAALEGRDGVPFPVSAEGEMIRTRAWSRSSDSVPSCPEGDSFAPSLDTSAPVSAQGQSTFGHMFPLWAAEAVGCAAAALDRTVAYVHVREAYGKRIGTFQAVQHTLADDLKTLELIRSGVIACALADTGRRELALDIVDRASSVIEDAVQLHGGIGFTWELGLHLYMRHVLALRSLIEQTAPESPVQP